MYEYIWDTDSHYLNFQISELSDPKKSDNPNARPNRTPRNPLRRKNLASLGYVWFGFDFCPLKAKSQPKG
jgi:hypothetical protein